MARQIKNFWLKIGTMFMTLYFMPLSHFVMSLFGRDTSQAYAGTIKCAKTDGYYERAECLGEGDMTLYDGQAIRCTCPTDSSKFQEYLCVIEDIDSWDAAQSQFISTKVPMFIIGDCEDIPVRCTNGETKDCSTDIQYGTRTCTNGEWGKCVLGNCKSGYIKVSDSCRVACYIENGTGYEYEVQEEVSSSSSSS